MWLLTNIESVTAGVDIKQHRFRNYTFFYDRDQYQPDKDSKIIWFVDGYSYPAKEEIEYSRSITPHEMLLFEYTRNKEDFIRHVKGNFIIIRLQPDKFYIYSDRFAIRKFFYWQNGNDYLISDNLKSITRNVRVNPSEINMRIYALTYHFTGGTTLFEDIKHNTPAQVIESDRGKLKFSVYWMPGQLLNIPRKKIDFREITEAIENAVVPGLREADNKTISLSLTGGSDTRNLLAVMLKKKVRPHLYTYGNPESSDCVKAKIIASGLGLDHTIHDIRMDSQTFEKNARRIISLSGGLASIHRVHRLLAIESEADYGRTMFLGTLGGEYIRGVSEDDYIIPAIVYENWNKDIIDKDDMQKYFIRKRLKWNIDTAVRLTEFFKDEPYFNGSVLSRKHHALSFITAHLHDAQDINLYSMVMDRVYTPYLDSDYLDLIFSTYYTFDQKEKTKCKFLRKINNPVYYARFLKETYKPLLYFQYSGGHKPSEVLFCKYSAGIIKYARQHIKPKYPSNFPLNAWMLEFVEKQLPMCAESQIIYNTFDLETLLSDLKTIRYVPVESWWLKYTIPITMRFILEEYGN